MHALVIYESIFGNTHSIAEAIAVGLRRGGEARVISVQDAGDYFIAWADLVVVGGPTHMHGMTRPMTRETARETAAEPETHLALDRSAGGYGVREWLASVEVVRDKRAAAFDTRLQAPSLITGRASTGIAEALRDHGFALIGKPESFLVNEHTVLVVGELARAQEWGRRLADIVAPKP